jgi:hypothetical protein
MAKRAVSNMDEGSKRKLITQLNNWIMKKETIE